LHSLEGIVILHAQLPWRIGIVESSMERRHDFGGPLVSNKHREGIGGDRWCMGGERGHWRDNDLRFRGGFMLEYGGRAFLVQAQAESREPRDWFCLDSLGFNPRYFEVFVTVVLNEDKLVLS
jgi:hypothetical protein